MEVHHREIAMTHQRLEKLEKNLLHWYNLPSDKALSSFCLIYKEGEVPGENEFYVRFQTVNIQIHNALFGKNVLG